jgi:lipid-A-disaccharide synthase
MRIGFVAGEASGDQLGAGLIRELRKAVPDLKCEGVAGPLMQNAGCIAWESSESLAVMGLIEPLREIPRLLRLRRMLLQRWTTRPPDVFVGIDAPDFNLGLEKKLRSSGVRTVHYVSPSVWAWRQGRIRNIRKAADTVLCLLPFEKKFYDQNGIDAVFVGHPMAEAMPKHPDTLKAREELEIASEQVVAVLPGSRMSEVSKLAAPFAAACRLLRDRHPQLTFVAPMAGPDLYRVFRQQLSKAGIADVVRMLDGQAPLAMTASDVVLLASGTATLQAALLGKPMVAAYRVSALTGFIAKSLRLLKTRWFSLPNLLTPDPMVEEFMQGDATPEKLSAAVSRLLDDPVACRRIAAVFGDLRTQLSRDADRLAAQAVLKLAQEPPTHELTA